MLFLLIALLMLGGPVKYAAAQERPNFLVIVVDDMGYSDPGCYGGEIATPHIDRLAQNGVRFSQFYNCSRCCQTRASLLTGAYPHHVGMREFGRTLDLNAPTLAENLRDGGYATGMVGKWHLTALPEKPVGQKRVLWMNHELALSTPFGDVRSFPTRRGFEKFYGIIWGVVDHFDPFSLTDGEQPVAEVPDGFYMTDAISQRAARYVDEFSDQQEPFFLYVAYTAPHWPIQAPEDAIEKYSGRYDAGWRALRSERFEKQQRLGMYAETTPVGDLSGDPPAWETLPAAEREYQSAKMAVHAAMVDRVDVGIGKIIDQLTATGQLDNTVVLLFSDNGASPETPGGPGYDRNGGTRDGRTALREDSLRRAGNRSKLGSDESYAGIGPHWASASNTPLRYWKAESYEGGCRTPLIVHWPDGLGNRRGEWVGEAGHVIDVAPTLYELSDVEPTNGTLRDGVSLARVLRHGESLRERYLFFDHGSGAGVRFGEWKASKLGRGTWRLFNLDRDPGETQDLAREHPDRLRSMVAEWEAFLSNSQDHPSLALKRDAAGELEAGQHNYRSGNADGLPPGVQ